MARSVHIAVAASMVMAFSGAAQASEPYVGVGAGVFNLGNGVIKKAVGGPYLQVGDDFWENLGGEFRIGTTGKTGEELTLQPRMRIDYYAAFYLKPRYQFNDAWMGYALLGGATYAPAIANPASLARRKPASAMPMAWVCNIDWLTAIAWVLSTHTCSANQKLMPPRSKQHFRDLKPAHCR